MSSDSLHEVVVVDNAPRTRETEAVVVRLQREGLPVRRVVEPRPGGANARNAGASESDADVVAFLDDDVVVDRHWLDFLEQAFLTDYQPDVVCGGVLPLALDTPQQVWADTHGGFVRDFFPRRFDIVENYPDDPLFPFAAGVLGTGANMAFRRKVLEELGPLDTSLGTATPTRGGEDVEYLRRAVLRGYRLLNEPAAFVRHEGPRDARALRRTVWGYGVGLGALQASMLADEPRRLLPLVRRVPSGLVRAMSGSGVHESTSNGAGAGYPVRLRLLEVSGLVWGPVALLQSRRRTRRPSTWQAWMDQ
jgi:GT2 family glycosyltransferase